MIQQFSKEWKEKYENLRRKIEYEIYNFIIPRDIPYVNEKSNSNDSYGWETIDLTDDCEIEIVLWFQYKINSKKLLLKTIELDVLKNIFKNSGDLDSISKLIIEFETEFWKEFLDILEKDYESIFWDSLLDNQCSIPTGLTRLSDNELIIFNGKEKFKISSEEMGIEGILTALISLYVNE